MARAPGRRSKQPSETRRIEIAAAALRCLERDGYARLTARKIAAEAGVSLGHLSYHFEDMNEILAEAYRQASERLRDDIAARAAPADAKPIERLRAFLHAGFTPEFLNSEGPRVRVDLWSAALAHEAIGRTERALYDRYRQTLVDLLLAIAAPHPDQAARATEASDAIMAMLDGLWLDWARRRDPAAIENGLNACLSLARTCS